MAITGQFVSCSLLHSLVIYREKLSNAPAINKIGEKFTIPEWLSQFCIACLNGVLLSVPSGIAAIMLGKIVISAYKLLIKRGIIKSPPVTPLNKFSLAFSLVTLTLAAYIFFLGIIFRASQNVSKLYKWEKEQLSQFQSISEKMLELAEQQLNLVKQNLDELTNVKSDLEKLKNEIMRKKQLLKCEKHLKHLRSTLVQSNLEAYFTRAVDIFSTLKANVNHAIQEQRFSFNVRNIFAELRAICQWPLDKTNDFVQASLYENEKIFDQSINEINLIGREILPARLQSYLQHQLAEVRWPSEGLAEKKFINSKLKTLLQSSPSLEQKQDFVLNLLRLPNLERISEKFELVELKLESLLIKLVKSIVQDLKTPEEKGNFFKLLWQKTSFGDKTRDLILNLLIQLLKKGEKIDGRCFLEFTNNFLRINSYTNLENNILENNILIKIQREQELYYCTFKNLFSEKAVGKSYPNFFEPFDHKKHYRITLLSDEDFSTYPYRSVTASISTTYEYSESFIVSLGIIPPHDIPILNNIPVSICLAHIYALEQMKNLSSPLDELPSHSDKNSFETSNFEKVEDNYPKLSNLAKEESNSPELIEFRDYVEKTQKLVLSIIITNELKNFPTLDSHFNDDLEGFILSKLLSSPHFSLRGDIQEEISFLEKAVRYDIINEERAYNLVKKQTCVGQSGEITSEKQTPKDKVEEVTTEEPLPNMPNFSGLLQRKLWQLKQTLLETLLIFDDEEPLIISPVLMGELLCGSHINIGLALISFIEKFNFENELSYSPQGKNFNYAIIDRGVNLLNIIKGKWEKANLSYEYDKRNTYEQKRDEPLLKYIHHCKKETELKSKLIIQGSFEEIEDFINDLWEWAKNRNLLRDEATVPTTLSSIAPHVQLSILNIT